MSDLVTLDGSVGEGGGQILRTALALSVITGRPLALHNIRANRSKPGLARQHQTCVRAAAAISRAEVRGDDLRSQTLHFAPMEKPLAGSYDFDIGTAGSTGLVLQTVLWPLTASSAESVVEIRGGTHNRAAPPFDFLEHSFAAAVATIGVDVGLELERTGFYPAGGGHVRARIAAPATLRQPRFLSREGDLRLGARIIVSRDNSDIASRAARAICEQSDIPADAIESIVVGGRGTAAAVHLLARADNICEVASGFLERGVPIERVVDETLIEFHRYLASDAPIGRASRRSVDHSHGPPKWWINRRDDAVSSHAYQHSDGRGVSRSDVLNVTARRQP